MAVILLNQSKPHIYSNKKSDSIKHNPVDVNVEQGSKAADQEPNLDRKDLDQVEYDERPKQKIQENLTYRHPDDQKSYEFKVSNSDNDQPDRFRIWHENGQLAIEAEMYEGKRHGKYIAWHENGTKAEEGAYLNTDLQNYFGIGWSDTLIYY